MTSKKMNVIWICRNHESEEGLWIWDQDNQYGICPDPDCNKKMEPFISISSLNEVLEERIKNLAPAKNELAILEDLIAKQEALEELQTFIREGLK